MNSIESGDIFAHIQQPLVYAEQMLAVFAGLPQILEQGDSLHALARHACELSRCELAQVYLLDAGRSRLQLSAEHVQGEQTSQPCAHRLTNHYDDELLQFTLCQNRMLYLDAVGEGVYATDFLPPVDKGWRSLLCLPLGNMNGVVEGLLVCASLQHRPLEHLASSLGLLGRVVLAHVTLLRRRRDSDQPDVLPTKPAICPSDYGLLGRSDVMRQMYRLIGKVLHSPYTVLLTGETGTGKEVVARALHEHSSRRSKRFIVQNCAAFPADLLESELFGYRKGAFTGADRDRQGLFDAADGGTLLLDEIGDMPLALQAKLLRVLQEGEIRPLGSSDTHKIDVRIVAATHRDLPALITQGQFRSDLYYRLMQFPIELPPLRERQGDILELAEYFAKTACTFMGREPLGWSDAALAHLAAYDFPGNVRELKGMVERAVLLCEGSHLQTRDFAAITRVCADDSPVHLREYMANVERAYTLACLRRNRGNQTRTARQLGLPRRTLIYRLNRLNVDLSEFQQ